MKLSPIAKSGGESTVFATAEKAEKAEKEESRRHEKGPDPCGRGP
jgi:hypothetical protein